MNSSKLIVLCGISGSGKSTLAKNLVETGFADVRVCRDNIREMLFGYNESNVKEYYSHPNLKDRERQVTTCVKSLVHGYLDRGMCVIIDQTNLSTKYLNEWKRFDVPVEFRLIDVEYDVAVARDKSRSRPVGKDIILKQYDNYKKVKAKFFNDGTVVNHTITPDIEPYIFQEGLPHCIIVDMDGTLAKMGDRSPYEFDKVDLDTANEHIKSIVNTYWAMNDNHEVFIFSAREGTEICLSKTSKWLNINNIGYDKIVLRPEKDMRRDWIVKLEMFNTHIRGRYNVDFWIDDRMQMHRFLRKLQVPAISNNPLGLEY